MKKLVIGFDEIQHFYEETVFFDNKRVDWPIVEDYIHNEFNWDMESAFDLPIIEWDNREIHLTFK